MVRASIQRSRPPDAGSAWAACVSELAPSVANCPYCAEPAADLRCGLRAGANGYLLKDACREELLECIRAVYDGRTWIPPAVAAKLATRIGGPDLTSRELEVLNLMVAGNSNKEIGTALGVSEGTIKAHVNRVLEKLGVSGRTEATAVALKRGIVRLE